MLLQRRHSFLSPQPAGRVRQQEPGVSCSSGPSLLLTRLPPAQLASLLQASMDSLVLWVWFSQWKVPARNWRMGRWSDRGVYSRAYVPPSKALAPVRGPSPFPTAPSSGLHSCLLTLPLQAWGWSLTHALKCPQHSLLVSPAPPVLLLNVPQLPPGLDTCSLPRP